MQWLNIYVGVRPRIFHTSCLLGYSTNNKYLIYWNIWWLLSANRPDWLRPYPLMKRNIFVALPKGGYIGRKCNWIFFLFFFSNVLSTTGLTCFVNPLLSNLMCKFNVQQRKSTLPLTIIYVLLFPRLVNGLAHTLDAYIPFTYTRQFNEQIKLARPRWAVWVNGSEQM